MSVDTKAYLPPHVRADDVAKVLAALLGRRVYAYNLPGGGFAAWCDDASVESTSIPEMAHVTVKSPDGDGFGAFFHFESDSARNYGHTDGTRLVTTYHSQRNVEVLSGLVRFFGGQLDADDCDNVDIDLDVSVQDATWAHPWSPNDGQEWTDFQNVILAVRSCVDEALVQA